MNGRENIEQKYNTSNMVLALENGNIEEISKNLYNVFENAVEGIEEITKELIKTNADRKFNDRFWLGRLWNI